MLAAAVYFLLPTILLILGIPIFLVLLVTSLVAVLTVADVPTEAIQTYMFGSLDNFPLLAVPFFILAGEIMAQGGIARRVVAWVDFDDRRHARFARGDDRGGIGIVRRHGAYGGRNGRRRRPHDLSVAGADGYDERFSIGLIASSGAIAVVIPPSIAMILYSMSAQESAIALFTAGILPSVLIGLVDAVYVLPMPASRLCRCVAGALEAISGLPPRKRAGRSARSW